MDIPLSVITHGQVTPQVLALFDITKPTMPRAFNVLEGLNRGQILVDDPADGTSAVVRDGMYGTLYFGGSVSASLLRSLVPHFRESGEVGIGCWLDDPIMASHNYGEPSFLLRHIRKDVSHALRLSERFEVSLTTANAAREVYRMGGRLGYDDAEFSAVFEALHSQANAGSYELG